MNPSLTPSEIKRLVVLEGDVSTPLLGLSPQTYEKLKIDVQLVIRSAASVNMIQSYEGESPPSYK